MAKFNIETPDDPAVKYFSYTASYKPGWFDIMRKSWQVIHDVEAANDGLVSVASQRWGDVQGNLEDVNHRALFSSGRCMLVLSVDARVAGLL